MRSRRERGCTRWGARPQNLRGALVLDRQFQTHCVLADSTQPYLRTMNWQTSSCGCRASDEVSADVTATDTSGQPTGMASAPLNGQAADQFRLGHQSRHESYITEGRPPKLVRLIMVAPFTGRSTVSTVPARSTVAPHRLDASRVPGISLLTRLHRDRVPDRSFPHWRSRTHSARPRSCSAATGEDRRGKG